MVEDTKPEKSNGQWHGGKGSVQKPSNQDKYAENWDKIFGNKKVEEDQYPNRARPDGFIFNEIKEELAKNDGPPMPNGLQRAWERKETK